MMGYRDLIFIRFTLQQIKQTIFAYILLIIQVHDQPGIQVTIIPELVIQIFLYKMKIFKNGFIGNKSYQRTILFFGS